MTMLGFLAPLPGFTAICAACSTGRTGDGVGDLLTKTIDIGVIFPLLLSG